MMYLAPHASTDKFFALLEEMKCALEAGERDSVVQCMGNLQAMIDWFQTAHDLHLCSEQIETEYNRYDETFDETAPLPLNRPS